MSKRIITSQGAPTTGFTDKGAPSPLAQAIRAVFDSWMGDRAVSYRRINRIPETATFPPEQERLYGYDADIELRQSV